MHVNSLQKLPQNFRRKKSELPPEVFKKVLAVFFLPKTVPLRGEEKEKKREEKEKRRKRKEKRVFRQNHAACLWISRICLEKGTLARFCYG